MLKSQILDFCTPAASGPAAMIFSNKEWIPTKDAYLHGMVILSRIHRNLYGYYEQERQILSEFLKQNLF